MKDYKAARKLGKASYKRSQQPSALDTEEEQEQRDADGYIILTHISELPVGNTSDLVTDLSALEARMDKFIYKTEKDEPRYKPEEKHEEKKKNKKSDKKARKKLLKSIFNNADKLSEFEDDEPDEDKKEDVKEDTLESTYGKRFSPMVSMIYDLIGEYDDIAADIQESLKNSTNARTMFKSSQTANLISAKNSKFSAIKELDAIATKVSDFEYKRDKDAAAAAKDSDGVTTKALASLTATYLRGGLDDDEPTDKPSKSNKSTKKTKKQTKPVETVEPIKKEKKRRAGYVSSATVSDIDEDIDEDENDDDELAKALSKALMKHKDELDFTPYEKHIGIEGKYTLAVLADADSPSSDWKFIALDKEGHEIKGFKDKYGDLVPKKSECHMSFDTSKLRVTDKNTSMTYKLLLR